MTLKKREKVLLGLTAVVLLGAGYYLLFAGGEGSASLSDLRTQRDKLQQDVDQKSEHLQRAARAKRKLDDWQHRALPTDENIASTDYMAWLRGVAERAKMTGLSVRALTPQPHSGVYAMLPFEVKCQGSIEKLVQFLYEFYAARHLHKLKTLDITPMEKEKARELQLTFTIEALSLPTADRRDKLTAEPAAKRLTLGDLADYGKVITGRNLFVEWTPPRPIVNPGPGPGPKPTPFDHLKFAKVTGITESKDDSKPQVWLLVQTTGQDFRLHAGEDFKIGETQGKILRVGLRDVDLEYGGERRRLTVGDDLRSGQLLPGSSARSDASLPPTASRDAEKTPEPQKTANRS